MRKIICLIVCLSGFQLLFGQQEQLYTQFMFNKLAINPAYAGNDGMMSITAIHRDQWTGFEGAPTTQLLSMNFPVGQRVGLGVNLSKNSIGISERITIEGAYSYRFPIGSGHLSIGAQASGRRLKVDYTSPELFAINGLNPDLAIESQKLSKNVLNFGAGAYYNTEKFYVGLSVPRLIQTDIDFDSDLMKSEEVLHLYMMSGYSFRLSESFTLTPQVLIKAVQNSPTDLDLNFSLSYKQLIYAGFTIRTGGEEDALGESLDFIFGLQINKKLLLSFAYDYTLSDIRNHENGSLEFLLSYRFQTKKKVEKPTNPRYF